MIAIVFVLHGSYDLMAIQKWMCYYCYYFGPAAQSL